MVSRDYDDDELRAVRRTAFERDDTPTAPHGLGSLAARGLAVCRGAVVQADAVAGAYEASDRPTPDPDDLKLRRVAVTSGGSR